MSIPLEREFNKLDLERFNKTMNLLPIELSFIGGFDDVASELRSMEIAPNPLRFFSALEDCRPAAQREREESACNDVLRRSGPSQRSASHHVSLLITQA